MLAAAEAVEASQTAEDIIADLKKAVFRGRIRMIEFFADFDPLRSGVISIHKFRTAIGASGIMVLTEKQMQLLQEYYVDPTDSQRVRYVDLLKELDAVFTTPAMQYDPHASVTDFTPALIKDEIMLDPESEAAVGVVLERIAHMVKVRGLLPRQPFDDYMKNVNSPIQARQPAPGARPPAVPPPARPRARRRRASAHPCFSAARRRWTR